MLYNAFQSARHPRSSPSHVGIYNPHVIHVPWTHLTQHPKMHLDQFSHFSTVYLHPHIAVFHSPGSISHRKMQGTDKYNKPTKSIWQHKVLICRTIICHFTATLTTTAGSLHAALADSCRHHSRVTMLCNVLLHIILLPIKCLLIFKKHIIAYYNIHEFINLQADQSAS